VVATPPKPTTPSKPPVVATPPKPTTPSKPPVVVSHPRPHYPGPIVERYPRPRPGIHHPHWPRRPILVLPVVPGIMNPPVVEASTPPGVTDPPPPGATNPPPPRQAGQPPQPPRRIVGSAPPSGERRYVPNEVIIEAETSLSNQQIDAIARRHRLTRVESFTLNLSGTTVFRWRIPDPGRRNVAAVVRALEGDVRIRAAQPNYLFSLAQETSPQDAGLQKAALPSKADEPAQLQYALSKLKLPQAHGLAKGDKILVAVIDSGIDADHPELAGMVAGQLDAVGGTGPKAHSHGTAIAGTIVAHAKLTGVAPSARILAVRAFGGPTGDGDATTYAILKGLDWATTQGARVVNMSFAGPADPAISRNIANARDRGVVLVAAAGNAGPRSAPLYPAADRNVIAVTATDADDKLFAKANRGRHITVAAPGVDILLPAPNAAYTVSSGTSFSASFVSGTVALMLERKPGLSPDLVREVLVNTAADLGPKGTDEQFGAGLIDAFNAVTAVAPVVPTETATMAPTPASAR
jgi:hypothetical protein